MRIWCGLIVGIALITLGGPRAFAERLPARAYTTADGLGHDRVLCVVQDSRGILWFCTVDGLSRFDGHSFVNYGERQGLPGVPVYSFIESRPGVYWVGTHGGLARFDATRAAGTVPFVTHDLGVEPARRPLLSFLRDRSGTLWAGGEAGLFRIDDSADDGEVRIAPVTLPGIDWSSVGRVRALLEDHEGSLWIAGETAIVRRTADRRAVSYAMQAGGRILKGRCLIEVEPGTIWIGTNDSVIVLRAEPQRVARGLDATAFAKAQPCRSGVNGPRPTVCEYGTTIGRAGSQIRSLFQASDGTIWIGAVNGISTFDGTQFRTYDKANGLTNETINAITIDRAGSVWLGTDLGGAIRIAPNGITTYTLADGLAATDVNQIVQDPAGRLYVVTLRRGWVHRFDGRSFHLVDLDFGPARSTKSASRSGRPGWWLDADPALHVPDQRFDDNQTHIFAAFPDSHGDVWLGEHTAARDNLMRWRHETMALQRFGAGHGEPTFDTGDTFDSTLVFAEDSHGGVWIGVVDGGVARFHDERFVWLRESSGALLRNVKDVSADRQGRIWIASSDGIWLANDPTATDLRATMVVPGSALGRIKCMTADRDGRLYVGTPNGLEQVDPQAGRVVRRYQRRRGCRTTKCWPLFATIPARCGSGPTRAFRGSSHRLSGSNHPRRCS